MHEELKTSIWYFFPSTRVFFKRFSLSKVLTRRMFDGLSEDTRHRSDSVILCKLRHPRGSVVTHNLWVLNVSFNTIMRDFMYKLIGHVTPKLSLCLSSSFHYIKGLRPHHSTHTSNFNILYELSCFLSSCLIPSTTHIIFSFK